MAGRKELSTNARDAGDFFGEWSEIPLDSRAGAVPYFRMAASAWLCGYERGEMVHVIATFDGGYNRKGKIWIEWGPCWACSHETLVLAVDASEEEYETGRICLECVQKAFADLKVLNK